MVALAKFFDWREALVIVKPETFVKWHRTAFKMCDDGDRATPAAKLVRRVYFVRPFFFNAENARSEFTLAMMLFPTSGS